MSLFSAYKSISICAVFSLLTGCISGILGLSRPQDPKHRPYYIETVTFPGGADVTLAGELTMPVGDGPFRAVVLITGSGPHDRNETIAGHRPFLVLSDHLTRSGYAVLRYDDRGVGGSSGSFSRASLSDFAVDAAVAHRWLSKHPKIKAALVGFIGHSEGGYIAPIAAQDVEAAFMIFLASPARRLLPDVMITQTKDLLEAQREHQSLVENADRQYRQASLILAGTGSVDEKRQALADYSDKEGLSRRQKAKVLKTFANSWGIEHARNDSQALLRKAHIPVLALFGGKDLQVSAKVEAPIMETLLQHSSSKVVVFEGLNHLFQPTETGLLSEYSKNDVTLAPAVLKGIVEWLSAL